MNSLVTLRHKDGHAVPVLINAIPLITDTKMGKTIQSVGVFTDLSEIKKMEEELLKAKKLESIGILAGGIAHDFNNLLTVILGNIEISRMFSKPGDKIFERLLDAEDASRKAGELSNRLITLSIRVMIFGVRLVYCIIGRLTCYSQAWQGSRE